MKWKIEYDNDTGPRDESFHEWWTVICGDTYFKCCSESEANWLCDILNKQLESAPSNTGEEEAVDGWIDVKDRLPERKPNVGYSQVWCLCVYRGEVLILVYNHEHICWDQEDGDDYFCDVSAVSHWQPLPKPPIKQSKEQ